MQVHAKATSRIRCAEVTIEANDFLQEAAIGPATYSDFEAQALANGFDEVLVREWAPATVLPTHAHPFSVEALVVRGEMWLTVGDDTRHMQAGDRFSLERDVPHAERYGEAGAAYWVARRNGPDALVTAGPAAASVAASETPAPPAVQGLSPAASAARLAELFPAVFGAGGPKPLKLRIQVDIQQRAPDVFTKKALSLFLQRYTTSTAYLKALAVATERTDLDGQPAGAPSDEHRQAALAELQRRRALHDERRATERAAERETQRKAHEETRLARESEGKAVTERAILLRAYETTTLTRANFCALKGLCESALDAALVQARQDRERQPPRLERDLSPRHEAFRREPTPRDGAHRDAAPRDTAHRGGPGPRDGTPPRGPARHEAQRANPGRPQSARPGLPNTGTARAGSGRVDGVRLDDGKADPRRTDPARARPAGADPRRADRAARAPSRPNTDPAHGPANTVPAHGPANTDPAQAAFAQPDPSLGQAAYGDTRGNTRAPEPQQDVATALPAPGSH